jgi:hypothetical protein
MTGQRITKRAVDALKPNRGLRAYVIGNHDEFASRRKCKSCLPNEALLFDDNADDHAASGESAYARRTSELNIITLIMHAGCAELVA